MRLYLASRSPRRRELLHQMGVEFDTISTEDQVKIVQFIDRNLTLSPTDDS